MLSAETRPVRSEGRRISLAERAHNFFISASVDYPASISAQGARITVLARVLGLSVDSLGSALLNDHKRLEAIEKSALKAHKRSADAPKDFKPDEVVKIVAAVYAKAAVFRHRLSHEDIVSIYTDIYPRHRTSGGLGKETTGLFIEDRIAPEIDLLIEKAQRRRLAA